MQYNLHLSLGSAYATRPNFCVQNKLPISKVWNASRGNQTPHGSNKVGTSNYGNNPGYQYPINALKDNAFFKLSSLTKLIKVGGRLTPLCIYVPQVSVTCGHPGGDLRTSHMTCHTHLWHAVTPQYMKW
ncbi:uncharacterized protein LACBIDRAFT_324713 [Laccaria bicolor S238N-H82]|uniref:Predicted protein n=1 Tax=Laccaria bicolor (strain S238N-H82 / ATCC MYA-4686) TaxID=486041 RepID=B0D2T3_LACBS|nr:uncharacterized protein LACBIDRAFT_324713 [Laccaria bicolor S238N-H82]EDR10807.1 predicted protein [Laccaria bicolor S238N-H82]|eukprot:XP_001878108.1 predicted protein [Laccaria bicolor S238N-H82]